MIKWHNYYYTVTTSLRRTALLQVVMLITKTYHDVPSNLSNERPIRIFVISPVVPGYPQARFPGVVCFSEIYQVTGPVERFAGQIASHGYVVACPSSFHEFEGPEPIPYDAEGSAAKPLLASG